jgi:maltose/moltooligosaccharide transporter
MTDPAAYSQATMRAFQKSKNNAFFSVLALPSTAMGFALSVQISALSWILTTQYGLDIHDVGLVWAAGPMAGIIGQVLIGLISDKVWFWGGRRRPFILIGGLLAAPMLLALPHLDVLSAGLGLGGILGVAIAVALSLDLAINISFNPTRSIIADVTEAGDERTKGYTWMQTVSGTFGVLAYAIGAVWDNYVLIYFGAAIVLLFSIVPTLLIQEPRELVADAPPAGRDGGDGSTLASVLTAIRPLWGFLAYDVYAMGRRIAGLEPDNYYAEIACAVATLVLVVQALMERQRTSRDGLAGFRKVIAAHSLSWVGIFTTLVLLIPYLQQALPDLGDIALGRVGSMSYLVLNAVGALLPALVLMPLAQRIGRVKTHAACLAIMTAGYVALWLGGDTPMQVYVLMAVLGVGWGAIVSLPFAIMSQTVQQSRMGLFMGLFNLSVVLPQLTVSLGVALFVSRAPDKGVIFLVSALAMALSTLAWSLVREEA